MAKKTKPSRKKRITKHSFPQSIISIFSVINEGDKNSLKSIEALDKEIQRFENREFIIILNTLNSQILNEVKNYQKKKEYIRVVVLSKEYDQDTTMTVGFDLAVGDIVINASLQSEKPEMIHELIHYLNNDYDIVYAQYPLQLYLKNNLLLQFLLRIINAVSKTNFLYWLNYYTACNRKVLNAVSRIKRKKRSFSYIFPLIGFRQKIVPYKPVSRKTKIKIPSFFTIFIRIIDSSISNSYRPLRFAALAGFGASFLNLLFLCYVFIVTLVKKNIAEGWITTSVIMGLMFFIVFAILTIISEYLLRILNESRNDPIYFIAEDYDSSDFQKEKKLNVL